MEIFIIGLIIAGVIMYAEYLLATKLQNPLWGGILPLIMTIITVYLFLSGTLTTSARNLYPFIIMICLLLGDWASGREKHKKNKEIELDKMKARDM